MTNNSLEKTLEKTYDPKQIEEKCYSAWEQQHCFEPNGDNGAFCIMIPPPNVTGSLHMGHAFEATIIDSLTRFHRMQGKKSLWQMGTDHAGIATQMVVERNLKKENSSREELGRDAFIDKIWQWKNTSGNNISQQLRRMGASVDWSRERFTMDEGLSNAVQTAFIRLYDEGLIYRGKRLVNWDPVFHSAISDLEVVSEEEDGHLWHINYPLSNGSGQLTVATTRPETLFGDVAIAIHPDDERYQQYIGQTVKLPLTEKKLPIIADDYVDPTFGTGCLKITPAHDFNDHEVGKRHGLSPINILTPNAALNENVPENYRGLDRFDARQKVVEELTQAGLLVKTQDHKHKVPRGDRSGAIIEPYLTNQWYVKVAPLAEPAIAAVENGDICFTPKQWENTYFSWMRDIQDWCISRQLWWGHRIPAWFDQNENIYVGKDEAEIRKKYQLNADVVLRQEEDVLDTWFSSALWPFSTLGWPEKTPDLATFYPNSTLVTGFDIIFFWVARMIMFGLKFVGKIPFKEIYIHGLIRDGDGKKMSKSKGNVLDPLDLIEGIELEPLLDKRSQHLMQPKMAEKIRKKTAKEFPEGIKGYGTDALRFTFASLASTGRNIQFDFNRLEGYRNFCNKLWNAGRYILMQTDNKDSDLGDGPLQYSLADQWIHSLLQKTIATTHQAIEQYRFDLAANALYDFVWHEFCDWYLELSKPVLNDQEATAALKRGTLHTLVEVFETSLRLLHPITPFITEEIWQKISPLSGREQPASIMLAAYPQAESRYHCEPAENAITWLKAVILAVRTIRGELNISPNKAIPVLLQHGNTADENFFHDNKQLLQSLAKAQEINYLDKNADTPVCSIALVNNLEVKVPVAGLIDLEAETQRLQKSLAKEQKELQRCQQKLNNPNYVNKAPAEVVEVERQRAEQSEDNIRKIKEQLESLEKVSL